MLDFMSAKYDEKKEWQNTAQAEVTALKEELAELRHNMKMQKESVSVALRRCISVIRL